jgi:hypothetical protein
MPYRFKLLAGKHSQKEPKIGPDGKVVKDPDGNPVMEPRLYRTGEIIVTNSDLVAKFNSPGAMKFQLMESPRRGARARGRQATEGEEEFLVDAEDEANTVEVTSSGETRRLPIPKTTFPGGQVASGHQISSGTGIHGEGPATLGELAGNVEVAPSQAHKVQARGRRAVVQPDAEEESETSTEEGGSEYDSMTVAQLREYAEENEIDLSGATRKDEIIKVINKSREGAQD